MRLIYKNDYLSVKSFDSVYISDFTILTGLNGAGKTHFLDAIKKGFIEIEGIENTEIVYYNFNDFTVSSGNFTNNVSSQNRVNEWSIGINQLLEKINKFKITIDSKIFSETSILEQSLYNIIKYSNETFDANLGQECNYVYLNDIKDELREKLHLYENKFSPYFFNFIYEFIFNRNGDVNEISYDGLKKTFEHLQKLIHNKLKEEDETLYDYLKSRIGEKSIFNISYIDFESPNFFLNEIANEEKEYQLRYTQNSLNKVLSEENNNSTYTYLSKDDFIAQFGQSPIEQINEVLNEYECNGYYLTTNSFQIPLGVDINQVNVHINLLQKSEGYYTNFEQLSSGEKTLISLSLLIYKSRKKKIIPRVLLLDEIDSSLHPSMISRLITVIQDIFIKKHKLKVLFATHSPTTVALGSEDSIFVINRNGKQKIVKQNQSEAISILTEGFATLNKGETTLSIKYNISRTDLPVLFTEGITDKIIIETAWEKVNGSKNKMPFYVQDCFSASFLANVFKNGTNRQDGIFANYSGRFFIALFDFDSAGFLHWNSLKFEDKFENDPSKCLTKKDKDWNAYALLLPVPNNQQIMRQVIKNDYATYESKSHLTIELLFYGVEELSSFFSVESVTGGGEIVDFKGDKKKFASKLRDLGIDAFKGLLPLFEMIEKIIISNDNVKRELK